MPQKTGTVVYLHIHRELPGKPEAELEKLLERLLWEKHHGNLLAASDAYADEKTEQAMLQLLSGQRIDREEFYEALIAWALVELGELTDEGEVILLHA